MFQIVSSGLPGRSGCLWDRLSLWGVIGGGNVVVAARHPGERPPEPILLRIDGAHAVAGVDVPGVPAKMANDSAYTCRGG